MRKSPCICVGSQQITFQSHVLTSPNVTQTFTSLIHPCIGVEDHAYAWKAPWQQATTHDQRLSHSCVAPNFTRPTHMRGSPRICVESSLVTFEAHVWKSSNVTLKMLSPLQSHAYMLDSQHMRGRQTQFPSSSSPRICVEASICVEAIQTQGQ
ncbi:hypothetical protein PIB30_074795, partial [Stylosanthes scabra]|nr:hypothetical protein [Stylosanthes scabra]